MLVIERDGRTPEGYLRCPPLSACIQIHGGEHPRSRQYRVKAPVIVPNWWIGLLPRRWVCTRLTNQAGRVFVSAEALDAHRLRKTQDRDHGMANCDFGVGGFGLDLGDLQGTIQIS